MHKSIRRKLIIYIVPFVLLILIFDSTFRILHSKKIIEQELYQQVLAEQDTRSSDVERTISKIKGTADSFSAGLSNTLGSLDINTYNEIIQDSLSNVSVIKSYGIWFEPYAMDPNQKLVRSFYQNVDGKITGNDYYNSDEFDYLNSDIYTRCKESNESFFAESYYDDLSNTYYVVYVTPIQNNEGEFIGCVSTGFSLKQLNGFITESANESINFYIVNKSGYYIANIDLELLDSRANILDDSRFKDNAQTILDSETGIFTYDVDNEKYYVYFSTVSNFEWKFIYEIPETLINKQLVNILITNILLFTITLVAIVVLIFFFSSRFVHAPFRLLLAEFKNISDNNFDSDITQKLLKTDTEFSDIGNALIDMKLNLTNYQNTLESNNKLLNESVNYVNSIISVLPIMMFILDRNGVCIECHGVDDFDNRPHNFYKGRHCYDFLGDNNKNNKDLAKFLEIIKTIDYSDGIISIELPIFVNGKQEFFEHTLTLCRDNEIISLCRRTTDNVNYMEHMKYLSSYDELTGVFNNRHFNDILKNYVVPNKLPVSVIILDVNGFKSINDDYGHRSGDILLIEFTNALNNIDSPNKIVARTSGDDFAVILPNTTKEEAECIFEEINSRCITKKVTNIPFSISFGVDTATTETDELLKISKSAEELLYKQKLYTSSGQKDNTIELINSTLLAKNKREQLHSNRVSELCGEMASVLGWSKLDQQKIKTAGLLHDIGKIGISDAILNKPGRLTDAEFEELSAHPEIGYRILQSSTNMKEISEFAYSHHEKWDGTGYPRQLKGTEIIIEARIIAIVDAYDAMTSSRSYREGLPKEVAIQELIRCKNTQFDPELVDIFIEKVLHEKLDDYEVLKSRSE